MSTTFACPVTPDRLADLTEVIMSHCGIAFVGYLVDSPTGFYADILIRIYNQLPLRLAMCPTSDDLNLTPESVSAYEAFADLIDPQPHELEFFEATAAETVLDSGWEYILFVSNLPQSRAFRLMVIQILRHMRFDMRRC